MNKHLVVVGQGYVGLPLSQAAARVGWKVTGYDTSPDAVEALNAGISRIDDLSDADIREMLDLGFSATDQPEVLAKADVAVICVPTPLSEGGGPDLAAVESATDAIAAYMKPGALVVLESTSYPGTTETVVLPRLEGGDRRHGDDFLLAFSPERVNPGFPEYGIVNTPKLVGGVTPEATEAAAAFYGTFVERVVPLSGTREAETAKLLENTYRHVNIALVNEMAVICNELGIDIWEVIRGAATKPFGFQKFTPGPGVGGHCIPIDPNYFGYEVRRELGRDFRFIDLAQEINAGMPGYISSRITRILNEDAKAVRGSRILLLGVTYKPDIADQRESPAVPLAQILRGLGAELSFYDPFVTTWFLEDGDLERVEDVLAAAAESDITVLLQAHRSLPTAEIAAVAPQFFDTRGTASGPNVTRL